ncbi:RHS repeat-associated core domain-containing protein [Acidovorax sp. LjRoot194]|uniref:RHS repeat-associated core domain-containing protein n=1 Tax=Acidovorax sp. LjRoot194 TaxID=3342280 RepID=UPI003ECCB9F0
MSTYPAAARIDDPIAHTSANARMLLQLAGVVGGGMLGGFVGGAIGGAVSAGLTFITGGFAAPAAPVITAAATLAGTHYGMQAGQALGTAAADFLFPPTVTGKIITGSENVKINGKKAARATNAMPLDSVICSKHTSRPTNFIAQGAADRPEQTLINHALAARKDDKVECGAYIHEGSPNVFIGGPPATVRKYDAEGNIFLRAAIIGYGIYSAIKSLKCLPKLLKDPRAVLKNAKCIVQMVQAGMSLNEIADIVANPVHIATGAKLLAGDEDLDFVLPGGLPVVFQRVYNSLDLRSRTHFGQGWSSPYTAELHLGTDVQGIPTVTYYGDDGRDIEYPVPAPGESHYSVAEGIAVLCSEGGDFFVVLPDGTHQWFGKPDDACVLGLGSRVLPLRRIEDRNSNFQALRYDELHRLTHLADNTGRLLAFDYEGEGNRIAQIRLVTGANTAAHEVPEIPEVLARYRYDGQGQLTEVIGRDGQIQRLFGYADGLMAQHRLSTGLTCHYRWQNFSQNLGKRSGPHPRVVQHWTDDGENYQFQYDLAAGTTTVTERLGSGESAQIRTRTWAWNADHEITAYTDALGNRYTQTWSDTRQLLSHTDPLGRTTTYAYDEAGNLIQTTDALGRTESTQWSPAPASLLLATSDAAGASWRYHYDNDGNLTAEIDPLGHTTLYANNERGLPLVITDAHGGRKQLAWDVRGLLTSYTDCSGKTTRYTYDQRGYLHQEVDALGHTTTLTHDAQGRLLTLTLPDGAAHHYRYDPSGQCVLAQDALGHSTSYSYNLRGQLTGRSKAIGSFSSNIQLGYDSARRLAVLVNENRQAYQFTYDAADRLLMETRIDGTRQVLHHDAAGQVVGVTEHPMSMGMGDAVPGHADVKPIHTQLVRDAAGQLIQKKIYLPGAGTGTTEAQLPELQTCIDYAYTPTGDLHQALQSNPQGEPQSRHSWQYDKLGQVLQETAEHTVQGQQRSTVLHYEYDALGNRTGTTLPDGRTLNHLYYGSGHLHQINLDGAVLADIERDDLHREVLRTQGRLASRFAYDPVGRKAATWVRPAMLRVGHGIGSDQRADSRWSPYSGDWTQRLQRQNPEDTLLKRYGYDKNGELTSVEHSQQGQTRHQYDQGGRITHTHATQPERNEHFHYDLAGNRINALEESNLSSQGRGWVQNNRVKVLQDKRYDYDGFGRLIRKRIGSHTEQHYRYDHQHRLTQVAVVRAGKDGQPQSQVFSYQYDALDRRIAKTDSFGTTVFTWEGMRLLQESRGAQTSTYIYEPGSYVPLARIDGSGSVEPHPAAAHALGGDAAQGKQASVPITNPQWADRFNVAAAANDEPGGSNTPNVRQGAGGEDVAQVYYFHTQPNGLPEELSDNSGNLVWRAQYTTWGSTVSEQWQSFDTAGRPQQQLESQTASLQQNLRMQGQYLDRETGLHYNTFRYYDADLGAFTTPDPIGLNGGFNLHQYAPNPINWIDPWGWACGPNWTKKGWKHVKERHVLTTKPRWAHKSKFELGKEGNLKKAIEKTVKHGKATPQKNGRTKYELDHKQKVGSKTDPQTGVSKDQTKITVVTDRHGNVVTSFPSD